MQAAETGGDTLAKTETGNVDRHWMRPVEAADYCGVDRITLWRARKRGDLRAGGPGRAVRFHRDELDRWMEGARDN